MAMRQVEIQARSVEEAVRLALEQMGRTREQVDVQVLAGTETGSEDDEVLVRVTAREQLSGAREREIRQARESGQPIEAAPRPYPPARERGPAGPPREGYRSEGPRGPRGDRVPFFAIVVVVAVLIALVLDPPKVLLAAFALYALSGPALWLRRRRGA